MERPNPASIPTTPGVYLYKDAGGRIIYVGKAVNLRKRVLSYFRPPERLTPKTAAMIRHASGLETLNTTTEKEALLLEASLIKKHRPRYNIVLRDDKQYVLFRLAVREDFPRLEIVRKARKRDGARYFGPFTSGMAAKETWKSIHRVFPLRRCSDRAMRNRVRPCLYHHIGLCLAPCTGETNREEYAVLTQSVALLLAGKSDELIGSLRRDMAEASDKLNFERAAMLRDQIRALQTTLERQAVVFQQGGDMDVLGLTTLNKGLALGILFVRQGRLLDRNTFFWPDLGLEEAGELIQSFLGQFYGPGASIPPRVVVPWLPEEPALETDPDADLTEARSTLAALESSLAETRGGPVRIALPRNAEEHGLVDMAKSNAREYARTRTDLPLSQRLAAVFHRREALVRLECVDISHTGGTAAKAGLVVYEEGKPRREEYRAWNMEDAQGDDYAALAAWAQCRVEHGAPWPDLLLVDGGKGQLAVVHAVFQQAFAESPAPRDLPGNAPPRYPFLLAGIAKARDERGRADRRAGNVADRIFVPGRGNPLPLREGSAELLFLQSVRDAAHDFSLGRHRQARAKLAFSGELRRLPGIGPHTAKLLWEHFPSIEDMRRASREDLAALPGIGDKRAARIHASLREM